MNRKIKNCIAAGMLAAASVFMSGCAIQYGDGLLALPSLPAEYVELQGEINKVLETGAVSAAAESGANRQSIQLVDIDGADVSIHADAKAAVRMLRVLAVVVGGQRLFKRTKGLYIIALGAIARSRRVGDLRVRTVPVLFSPAAETAVFPDYLR